MELTDKLIFDPSLLVIIYRRITDKEINDMTVRLLKHKAASRKSNRNNNANRCLQPSDTSNTQQEKRTERDGADDFVKEFTDSKGHHKGILKVDETKSLSLPCENEEERLLYSICQNLTLLPV